MQREYSAVDADIAAAEASGVTTNTTGGWPKWLGGSGGDLTEEAKKLQALYEKRAKIKLDLEAADAARGIPPLVSSGAAPAAVAPAEVAKTPTSANLRWDPATRKLVPK